MSELMLSSFSMLNDRLAGCWVMPIQEDLDEGAGRAITLQVVRSLPIVLRKAGLESIRS